MRELLSSFPDIWELGALKARFNKVQMAFFSPLILWKHLQPVLFVSVFISHLHVTSETFF
jgi:hypothetical protein